MFGAMHISLKTSPNLRPCVFAPLLLLVAILLALPLVLPITANAQSVPDAAYGPFNAAILVDGPGLTKPLTAPSAIDPRAAGMLDRLGIKQPDTRDSLLQGGGTWTLAFWFRSSSAKASEPAKGMVLLAGIGDPAAEDARFIGLSDNHLALWLGRNSSGTNSVSADNALNDATWHLAVAVGDGRKIILYANGKQVATSSAAQGGVAGRVELAPQPPVGTEGQHFGGKIFGLKVYRDALTAEQIANFAAAPPDFDLAAYEDASQHWAAQTRGMAGQIEPQDPSTLPRGKGGFQKPVAKPLTAAELRTEMVGTNPWKLQGGWKLAAAPGIKATGEELSKPGYATNAWMAATVPGTVLTTMIDRGIYPDPDYGLNNMAIPESLSHQDYWYRVEFKAPAESRGERLTLTFEGVNYAAEVWLNGHELGGFTGAFIRGRFDVTVLIAKSGENALAVRVSPPPHPGIAHEQSIKAGPGENGGIQVIDGPTFAATEGWDWIPGIRDRNTGIWQDVTLTATGAVLVGDLQVVTTLPKPDRSDEIHHTRSVCGAQ
jgi:hypothetical protein